MKEKEIDELLEQIRRGESPYVDTDEIIDACEILFPAQRFADVETLTEFGLKLHPEADDLRTQKAKVLIDTDKFAEAKELLKSVKENLKDDTDFNVTNGWLYLKQFKIREAMKYFNRAVALDDDKLGLEFEIGLNLNQYMYFKEALKFLKSYSKKHPDDPEAMFEMAYALDKLEKIDESIDLYETLLYRFPLYETAWYNLAIVYTKKEQRSDALMAYDSALAINPNYWEVYFNKANLCLMCHQYDEAIKNYSEFISLSNTETHIKAVLPMMGECWWQKEDYEMAMKCYQKAHDMGFHKNEMLYGCALCLIELRRYEEALKTFNIITKNDPKNADYHFAKSQALYKLERKTDSLNELMRGIKNEPESVIEWREAMIMFCDLADDHITAPKVFIEKYRKRYHKTGSFKMLSAYVLYMSYLRDPNVTMVRDEAYHIIENLIPDHGNVIWDASTSGPYMKMLKDEKIKKMLIEKGFNFYMPE